MTKEQLKEAIERQEVSNLEKTAVREYWVGKGTLALQESNRCFGLAADCSRIIGNGVETLASMRRKLEELESKP